MGTRKWILGMCEVSMTLRNRKKEKISSLFNLFSTGLVSRETVLIFCLLFAQALMLLTSIGMVPIEWHAMQSHQNTLELVENGKIVLASSQRIGPGNLGPYGPILNYLVAPFYLLVPSYYTFMVVVALSYVASTYILYRLGKDFFNASTGWISAIFFAFSSMTIIGASSGFNATLHPFFGLLLFYSLLHVLSAKKRSYLVLALFSLAVLLQLHYTSFGALIITVLVIFYALRRHADPKKCWQSLSIGLLLFFLLFSPYIFWEFQNDFRDTEARIAFLRGERDNIGARFQDQSMPSIIAENTLDFLLFRSPTNPLSVSWWEMNGCATGSWEMPSSLEYFSEFSRAFSLLMHLVFLFSLPFVVWIARGNQGDSSGRRSILLILSWLVVAALAYFSIPPIDNWGMHSHFLFVPMVILIAFTMSRLTDMMEPLVPLFTPVFYVLLILSAIAIAVSFTQFKLSAPPDCPMRQSPFSLKTFYTLQSTLQDQLGTLPPTIELLDTQWPFLRPVLVPPRSKESPPPDRRFFLVDKTRFEGICFSGDYHYETGRILLFSLPSSDVDPSYRLTIDESKEWYVDSFDDSSWDDVQPYFVCKHCGAIIPGDGELAPLPYVERQAVPEFFLRVRFSGPVDPATDLAILYLMNPSPGDIQIIEAYFNGFPLQNRGTDTNTTLQSRYPPIIHDVSDTFNADGVNHYALRVRPEFEWDVAINPFLLFAKDCSSLH